MNAAPNLTEILDRQWSLLIGGRLTPAVSGRYYDDESPVTEEVIAAVPDAGAASRLLLHESVADEVLDRVARRMAEIRVGSPLDPDTEMGTLSSRPQYDKTMSYSPSGLGKGGK